MKTEIFEQLKKAIKRDTSNTDLQSIGFIAKHCNYELSFYAEEENAHELVVEHCGYTVSDKWYEETLTPEQEKELQSIVNYEIVVVVKNIKEEEVENNRSLFDGYFGDDYESTGTSQSDFY